jgi:uncharacterized protein YuzE
MRLDYDLNAGALYISLSDHDVARTRVVDDNTCVDLDVGGVVVGIEVIAVDYPWPVDAVLRDYPIAADEAAQLRAYFRPSIPGTSPAAAPVTRHEAPALSIAAGSVAA